MPISEPSSRHLLTVEETAERLTVSVTTVRRRIWDRELPCLRLGSGPQAPIRVIRTTSTTSCMALVESHPQ
jgi:excisionase family DNA binding protein